MWAGRRLRMVLDGENRVFPVPNTFDRSVVEVKVRDIKRLRAGHRRRLPADRKAVVLGRDKYLPRCEITYWMIAAAMAIGQFDCLSAQRETHQLMAEADPKDRYCPVGQIANGFDCVSHGGRIAGTVGQEDAVRFEVADGSRGRRRGQDRKSTRLNSSHGSISYAVFC